MTFAQRGERKLRVVDSAVFVADDETAVPTSECGDDMATIKQALRVLRSVCRALPGTTEKERYGETCFAAFGKMFAGCGEKFGVGRIVVQLEPEHARRLVASNPRFAPYLRQKHCVWIHVADIDDWDQIRSLVLESYRLNAPEPAAADKPRPGKKKPPKK